MASKAARAWNYTMGEWLRESPLVQALVVADYQADGIRDGYAAHLAKLDAEHEPEPLRETPTPTWGRFRQGGGSE